MPHDHAPAFVPAMGREAWLPVYDLVARLAGAHRVYRAVAATPDLRPGARVLDVGCGTGTVALAVQRRHPDASVVGLDPDGRVLDRARRKAARSGLAVQFDEGYAQALPYPDGSFDRVLSTLMLHHLGRGPKAAMLAEVRRVLAPGGSFVVADVAGPVGLHGLLGLLARHRPVAAHRAPDADAVPNLTVPNLAGPNLAGPNLAGPNLAGPNLAGPNLAGPNLAVPNLAVPNLLRAAGLGEPERLGTIRTRLGAVEMYRATV